MNLRGRQRPARPAFELIHDLRDGAVCAADDEVNMLRKDSAGMKAEEPMGHDFLEAEGDGHGLVSVPSDRWMFEELFHGEAMVAVVGNGGDGFSGFDFGGLSAGEEEFPCADEVGPASARVVGEPEAVGGEDHVVAEDHGRSACGPEGRG